MPTLRNGSKGGFEPGLSRLRVRHFTTELLRSTNCMMNCKNYEGNEDDVIPMIITNIIPMQLFTVMVAAIANMYIITIFKYVGIINHQPSVVGILDDNALLHTRNNARHDSIKFG